MEIILFISISLCFPLTAIVIFSYLKSSFLLLELVQEEELLWKSLGEPRKVWVREGQGGFQTIKPIGPWLAWVWAANTSSTNQRLTICLKKTSLLLKAGLALFALTAAAIITIG